MEMQLSSMAHSEHGIPNLFRIRRSLPCSDICPSTLFLPHRSLPVTVKRTVVGFDSDQISSSSSSSSSQIIPAGVSSSITPVHRRDADTLAPRYDHLHSSIVITRTSASVRSPWVLASHAIDEAIFPPPLLHHISHDPTLSLKEHLPPDG